MKPNLSLPEISGHMPGASDAESAVAPKGRRGMKPKFPFGSTDLRQVFSSLLCAAMLVAPQSAHAAFSWEWISKLLVIETAYRRADDVSRQAGFTCKMRNAWGNCIIFIAENDTENAKPVYHRLSSFGANN